MYSLYLPIPNCTYVFLVWWTKTSLEDVACHIFRTPVYCLKIMPDILWQFCFLSLKKRTFKLEPFFFISVQKLLPFFPFFKFEKLTSLTFMITCRLVIKFDQLLSYCKRKVSIKKFYKKYGLDTSPRPLVLIKNQALITWWVCHITREKFLSKISAKKYGLETSPRPFVFIKNQRLHVLLRMEFLKQAHYIKSVIAQLPPYVSIKADFHWSLSERIL